MGCCSAKKEVKQPEPLPVRRKTKKEGDVVINQSNFVQLIKGKVSKYYEIMNNLGDGGFGQVKQGKHKKTGMVRAIKRILLESTSPVDIGKMMDEVNNLKRLDHPNIIKVYEVYQDPLYISIVTELCTGGELFSKIRELKHFSENRAAKYMYEIVSAVKYCHADRIVHRDLKPENILLENKSPDAKLKLIDFGTSHYIRPNSKMKRFIGTSYYIAPEVIAGKYDLKCDVWSLGVILYIMLSGLPPFYAKSDRELYKKIQSKPVRFKKSVWSSISKDAKDLIRSMLTKDPESRPDMEQVYHSK